MSIDDRFERIEEKYDGVKELINLGKEKGYLLYDEVNDVLPHDINSSKDLDSIFYLFGDAGIEVIDSEQQLEAVKRKARSKSTDEDDHPDPVTETLEKTNDPVRMYLREMGTVPLLTRQGEVEIAKRIEKGQKVVIKALSRSPVVVGEISKYGEKLRENGLSIKHLVQMSDEESADGVLEKRRKSVLKRIDEITVMEAEAAKVRKQL
ncbi:MAG: RNA polymerase sigma factor RpoD, partial [Acidobacteria bacterium]|nr:RNA polymerase sigma factor RpoD [Acidobacteriota bacterium]